MSTIARPRSLSALVLDRLRQMIVSGDLELGASLSERRLSEALAVSKTPVREALAQLRNEGLVTIVPQSGAKVFTLSAMEVREVCEFRATMESVAIKLSFERNRSGLEQDLSRIVEDMSMAREANDIKGYLALDTAFHLTFFEHCGNSLLQNAYGLYSGKIAALRTHLATIPKHTSLSFAEHKKILRFIKNGAVDRLLETLEMHIGRTRETYEIGIEDITMADSLSK